MKASPWALFMLFGQLSLLSFGGGNSVLPEMQRQIVSVHHWLTAQEFSALFALAQAAPGPNLMIVVLLGWHLGGLPGALVSTLAMFGPSGALVMFALGQWKRHHHRPWHAHLRKAILPVTVGLLAATAGVIGSAVAVSPGAIAITVIAFVVLALRKASPLLVLAGGACLGAIFQA